MINLRERVHIHIHAYTGHRYIICLTKWCEDTGKAALATIFFFLAVIAIYVFFFFEAKIATA